MWGTLGLAFVGVDYEERFDFLHISSWLRKIYKFSPFLEHFLEKSSVRGRLIISYFS